jgi:hypothetical protein
MVAYVWDICGEGRVTDMRMLTHSSAALDIFKQQRRRRRRRRTRRRVRRMSRKEIRKDTVFPFFFFFSNLESGEKIIFVLSLGCLCFPLVRSRHFFLHFHRPRGKKFL